MSISAIGSAASTPAADNSATVRLNLDQQKLLADTQAKVSQTQLAADRLAIAKDQVAVSHNGGHAVSLNL